MNVVDTLDFSFVSDGVIGRSGASVQSSSVERAVVPEEFSFNQSVSQGFYFFETVSVNGSSIEDGDWILAYNDGVVVGAREYRGEIVDVPVMGYDGSIYTTGYIEDGDVPEFKVFSLRTGEVIDLQGNVPAWSENEVHLVQRVSSDAADISGFELGTPYPNPFNPSTKINFEVLESKDIRLVVYDLQGREVEVIVDSHLSPGFYNTKWDADSFSSGIYFLRMVSSTGSVSKKLMLVK